MSISRLTELLEPGFTSPAISAVAIEIPVQSHHVKHQITIEVVLTATSVAHIPAAGTLQIAFKSRGAVAYEDFVGTQNLTTAPLTVTKDGAYDFFKFTPANLDGDCSFRIKYSGYRI